MVKRGGTKRKADMRKITDKSSKAVTFSKRRDGLFSKAAQLCVLGDAHIAILATPSSSNSNVSFFSFGHSSVDSVVSAYLSGQRPVPVPEESKEMREDIGICMARKELGLGYWWDDDKLASKSPQEIMQAMESMKILLRDAERLLGDEAVDFDQRQGKTLIDVHEKKEDDSDVVLHHQNGIGKIPIDVDDDDDDDDSLPQTLITTEWSDMDLDLLLSDDLLDEKTKEEEDEHHHHHTEAVSENYCSNSDDLLSPAAGRGLNDGNDQNLLDLDISDLDLDTIYEGLANLDDDLVASFFM
ncbi:hypothetical protein Bca4012_064834 [Brassica carinata]|uniref:MADS-box domain-containing protein n=1 Tax=Brassica carinata TaxID=52824 RepID=A0A8X8AY51_BRACI|nr:hypothetical protein Bca52824_017294 [Brassica carinata]